MIPFRGAIPCAPKELDWLEQAMDTDAVAGVRGI